MVERRDAVFPLCRSNLLWETNLPAGASDDTELLLTDFVLGYKPTIWGNFQWAANPGVPDNTTTAREDPGHLKISSAGRPRSYRP